VPIFILVAYIGIPGSILGISNTFLVLDLIFIIASLTDKLDGSIARKYNLVTDFGKFLDPIADKILVLSALVMLVELGKIPAWIPIIVLSREFIVSGYRLVAAQNSGKVIAANIWGKVKTATQMVAIILIFIDQYNFFDFVSKYGEMGWFGVTLNTISSILMLISVIATIFSGWNYIKGGKDLLKNA
jgi:CDP-diacylglycerol--glycerol-3-phosphate 3-phosphatidyltransferase